MQKQQQQQGDLVINQTENSESKAAFDEEEEGEDPEITSVYSNHYRLVGIVVHSGQANGGHYYSFIQNKPTNCADEESKQTDSSNDTNSIYSNGSESNWYKFDDNEVSDFKMDEEEMRSQCYGGDYTGEVYDNVMKRMAYKKQKRWWNAYILFYERIRHDSLNQTTNLTIKSGLKSTLDEQQQQQQQQAVKIPANILKSVHKKNIKFLHHRHHFSLEYFQFIKKLSQANLCLIQSDSPIVNFIIILIFFTFLSFLFFI